MLKSELIERIDQARLAAKQVVISLQNERITLPEEQEGGIFIGNEFHHKMAVNFAVAVVERLTIEGRHEDV